MTEAIYLEVAEMAETAHKAKRRVSVSGMLKHLGVSRSGYHAWLKRVPSNTEKRREAVKAKIQDIYDESKQNYGAPKITRELRKSGEIISERTVGKYMKQMGIKTQRVKPWTMPLIAIFTHTTLNDAILLLIIKHQLNATIRQCFCLM